MGNYCVTWQPFSAGYDASFDADGRLAKAEYTILRGPAVFCRVTVTPLPQRDGVRVNLSAKWAKADQAKRVRLVKDMLCYVHDKLAELDPSSRDRAASHAALGALAGLMTQYLNAPVRPRARQN
jgi:hypothetical protein